MAGKVLGKAYATGIGMCLVSEAESSNYFVLTSEDTGREYHRARKNVMWRRTEKTTQVSNEWRKR